MDKPKIRIVGYQAGMRSLNCRQENDDVTPQRFDWYYGEEDTEIIVYVEHMIGKPVTDRSQKRVAMLFEPYELRPWHYDAAVATRRDYDLILTHHPDFVALGAPFAFYTLGGSFIKDWGIFPKSRLVSHVPGFKDLLSGHKLRHEVTRRFGDRIDVFPYPFESKASALRDFRYSIIIENSKVDHWFTEKLIDCLSQGTVPIYYGCPEIGKFFNTRGFFLFRDIGELPSIIDSLSEEDYRLRLEAIHANLETARLYRCTEDWLSTHYPNFFYGSA